MQAKDILPLIANIQARVLTSHNIVSRIHYPVYQKSEDVPELLVVFKRRIVAYRQTAAEYAKELAKREGLAFSSEIPDEFRDISKPTFAQTLVCGLASASFGLGECSECASLMAVELIKAGHTSLGFVSIHFTHTSENTEQGHQFLVTNLPNRANPVAGYPGMPLLEFFRVLPEASLVVDPYLELCFRPNEIPEIFDAYLKAYGGRAVLANFTHLFNYRERTLRPYLEISEKIREHLSLTVYQEEQKEDLLLGKHLTDYLPTLIQGLNKTFRELYFLSVRLKDRVDALALIENDVDEDAAKSLQKSLKGYGRFFVSHNKKYFILEGLNLPEGESYQTLLYQFIKNRRRPAMHAGLFQRETQITPQEQEALLRKYQLDTEASLPTKETALRRAAATGNKDDVMTLADEMHANINAQDQNPNRKRTALHWAAEKNHQMICCILLMRGADPFIKDASGKIAFDYNEELKDTVAHLYQGEEGPFPATIASRFLWRFPEDDGKSKASFAR